jgi:two-component system nitrate/nitrite response regulator NarL
MKQHDGKPGRPLTYSEILSRLTRRQREVLELYLDCLNEAHVAKTLGLTEGTVRTYLREIMLRLHVFGRTELLKFVYEAKQREGDGSSSASSNADDRASEPERPEAPA